jgi:hypothetical protein
MQAKCQSTLVYQVHVDPLVCARVGQYGQNAVARDNQRADCDTL